MEDELLFDYTDIDNIEDISDVYTMDIVNSDESTIDYLNSINSDESEEIVTGSAAESSAPTGYDDTNLIESINTVNESIIGTYEDLANISHRIDQNYDLIIAITLLLGAFIAISVFRKLFDWLV